jgi:hypothetical protein
VKKKFYINQIGNYPEEEIKTYLESIKAKRKRVWKHSVMGREYQKRIDYINDYLNKKPIKTKIAKKKKKKKPKAPLCI